ncbi:hypothetical protein pb186bvf_003922 [Paramecium bursaria]
MTQFQQLILSINAINYIEAKNCKYFFLRLVIKLNLGVKYNL